MEQWATNITCWRIKTLALARVCTLTQTSQKLSKRPTERSAICTLRSRGHLEVALCSSSSTVWGMILLRIRRTVLWGWVMDIRRLTAHLLLERSIRSGRACSPGIKRISTTGTSSPLAMPTGHRERRRTCRFTCKTRRSSKRADQLSIKEETTPRISGSSMMSRNQS